VHRCCRRVGRRFRFSFFFFSSRRRHTRFSRDWSSDVCSSDLQAPNLSKRGDATFRSGGVREILMPRPFAPGVPDTRSFPLPLWRSEEHTSELQSRENLVCRLLLEKKKKN